MRRTYQYDRNEAPAGPITVFDGGSYAGDALIKFFPENDKRFIAYGEDLSVTGSITANTTQETLSVKVAQGVMTITRRNTLTRKYTFKNTAAEPRKVIVEHPIQSGSELALPAKYDERTDSLYRFTISVPANGETVFEVKEQTPSYETVRLSQLRLETIVYYSSNHNIPEKIQSALQKAIEFKKAADNAQTALTELETKRTEKISEQDRIRKNLQAAGNETQQGREYLRRMFEVDTEIDSLNTQIAAARKNVQDSKTLYDQYISGLTLE
ncbi:DUF4139 domain-containing protein [Brucepastera parasyntrophica]|uniref:DUF4139 domain-containing protein n=1 Tax=Brucepastera parasyntrophica TaxID=2880008 RepID=UPI00210E95BA|nr:DUF4139 domain-containing protein [Brucepastera parasyntrophica]ULQ58595.1 DUF4139 domain-containing protein [Brucepastera parasyntrophica]